MSRLPTALTSSTLPGLTLVISLPTATTFSGSTLFPGISPPTGVVPGAGFFAVSEVLSPVGVVADGCVAGGVAGISPPTGVVPGAGWAVGALEGAVVVLVDCAPIATANASTDPASTTVRKPLNFGFMI